MFKNALIYRIEQGTVPALDDLESRLGSGRFIECGATQTESSGWVAPRGVDHAALAESVGGQLVLRLCTETKAVPGSVVKTELQSQLEAIEQQTGRRPRGKQAREIKDAVVHALLPRAFPRRADTVIWLDPVAGLAWVGAGSARRGDAAVSRLLDALGADLRFTLLQTAMSPAAAMSMWLAEKTPPSGFSIDRECELKQPDSEKATVRYARHTLDIDEVGEHIRQGKLPTRLALTWAGRVSFVLTETLTLKKIELLDGVLEEGGGAPGGEDDGFDANVAIATGELRQLLPALIDALGGLHERQAPADGALPTPASAPAAAAAGAVAEPAAAAATDEVPWTT
jgi:recombination associated protein RdgC